MNKESLSFLKDLMRQPSPSGFEVPAQRIIKARMKSFADKVTTDVHGNVIGILNEKAPLKVMLAGHVDEIGLMITHIDSNGFIYFAAIGGMDPVVAVGQRICIIARHGSVRGVIGRKPIHLMDSSEKGKELKMDDLWIDIGAKNKKDALKAVAIGDPIVVNPDFIEMRNELVSSRAFDDRIGAWVIVEVLRGLKGRKLKVAVHAVSTVQEELGGRGAITSAYNIHPDAGIAVDVGFASDCPGVDPKKVGDIALGKGPILHVGANINPILGQMLITTATKNRIRYQMQAEPRGTGTDANPIQLSRGGCAAALVSVPNRYMHTPVEVVSLKDLDATVTLIAQTLLAMKGNESFIPN
ncbi:MAG: M42 family metallopeptidase [Verrucomicrobia bacterium]|nr:M42 family metallopeptidase [Verrucomicrobiota bacterium]MBU4429761.1 M42 family metallopeptidase [Verrucomicrobiota bacterium]MCG2680381.1 M42 family metallopeptidase [Kiritimatiellia bacterium]